MMRIKDILKRVGDVINSHQNKDIAASLGVAETTCSTWKNRNTIPCVELILFAQKNKLSLNWLFLGIQDSDCALPPEIQKESDKIAKILASDYQHIKDELISYLNKLVVDCEMADRNAAKFKRLEEQNKEMQRELKELRKREPLRHSAARGDPGQHGGGKTG